MTYDPPYRDHATDIDPTCVPEATQLGEDNHPAHYIADPGLVNAVNVALALKRPLLLTGDPGTGKTHLAFSVAYQLCGRGKLGIASGYVERFEAKSSSVARDLFYTFDTLRRFHAHYVGGSTDNKDYITYNALGRALLKAVPWSHASRAVPAGFRAQTPSRSVVLIDEIDKAPRDFPNDLLNEIDQMFFRITELENLELGGPAQLEPALWPLVFITSNSEKNLPEPFLRRCVYYHIPPPKGAALHAILRARLEALMPQPGKLLEDAIAFFERQRDGAAKSRPLSPPELTQWLAFMLHAGADASAPLKQASGQALAGLSALSKDSGDQERLRVALEKYVGLA